MGHVNVNIDMTRALAKFGMAEAEATKAIVRALNKTATTARAKASREIQQAGFAIKAADLKDSLTIRQATKSFLQIAVRATGRPIPLIKWGAKQTRKGVTVKVKGGRKLITGAFIATMKSGHTGVYVRRKGMQPGKRGNPILDRRLARELFGPAIPSMFMAEAVQRATISAIRDRFPVALEQELNYLRSQAKA